MRAVMEAPDQNEPRRAWRAAFYAVISLYAAAFLLYAETSAFTWDESYHLLAAQLILRGRRPYLDFCFPQSPLNAYWNAAWMAVFGQTWRVAHTAAALLTIAAVVIAADFIARRFPVSAWRLPGAVVVVLAAGLNVLVFLYAPLAQPYGMCLIGMVLAFRFAIEAVGRARPWLAAATGFCAALAAASSLLSAAAGVVFFLWLLVYNRAGSRLHKAIAYALGAVILFLPVLRLFVLGPRQTWFNVVQYHATYRRLYWPDATRHDLEVLTSWIDSGPALLLGLLAVGGLVYVARRSNWTRSVKAEFYLAAWLAAALSAEVGRAHPTFPQYFLLIAPFLAILAAAGVYAIGSRVFAPDRPRWAVAVVCVLFALALARTVYDHREDDTWRIYERVAARIDQVTPPNAPIYANEPIFFLTRRTPPPGYELYYTHKLNLPPAERSLLHILTRDEVKQQVQSGAFVTAYSCDDDEVEDLGLNRLYSRSEDIGDCTVFWDRRKPGPSLGK